jgi:hypothetical protein
MWPVSAAFTAALTQNTRRWRTRMEVLYGGDIVTTLNTLLDGYVNFDSVAVRRSAYLNLVDVDGNLTPSSARDLLAPKGTEIRIFKGLEVSPGTYEEVPLGVFGVVEPEVTSHDSGTKLKIKGWDRVDAIRVRQFENAYAIAAGTPTADAISDIITSRLSVPVRVTQTGHTTPESVFDALSDPWDAVRALADADNLTAYFDPLGTGVVEPDLEVLTDVTYTVGENALLTSVPSRTIKADKTYSGVIVRGEHPETGALRSELWDTDPTSPTYADGPFGRRPYGFYSKLLDTQGKCDDAAATIFARVTKMRQELTIMTIGTPGHDVGDVVRVIDPKSRTNGYFKVVGGQVQARLGENRLKLEEAQSVG